MFNPIRRAIFRRKLEAKIARERKEREHQLMVQRAGRQVVRLYNHDSHAIALGLRYDVLSDLKLFLDELED